MKNVAKMMGYQWKGTKIEAVEGLIAHSATLLDEVNRFREILNDPNTNLNSVLQKLGKLIFGISILREEQVIVMKQVIKHIDTVLIPSLFD